MPHPFCAQTDLGSDLRSCSVSNSVEEVIVEGGRLYEERGKGVGDREVGERGEEREKGEERGSKREGGRETVEEKMSIDIM